MEQAATPSILSLEEVGFRPDDDWVIQGVTFDLKAGESLIVKGAASSGKTVLLKIIQGLLRPIEGRLLLFGQDVTHFEERDWYDIRARIGVLFQEGGLFDSLTIEDNVAYPLRNQPLLHIEESALLPRVEKSLEFVELGHTLEKFPSELSGGMRRRVGIARAIVAQPELMLYDSPTAGLDPITANTIMELIVKGRDARQATTVIVTHRAQDGELMSNFRYDAKLGRLVPVDEAHEPLPTRYLVMREGKVAFLGSPEELSESLDPYLMRFAPKELVES